MVKKGIFFSIDALIAVILLLGVIVLIPLSQKSEQTPTQPVYFSSDLVQVLATLTLAEIQDPIVLSIINNSNISDLNRTIVEQALRFQVEGNDVQATALLNATLGDLIPSEYGISIWNEGFSTPVYTTNQSTTTLLISSKQLVSGIEKDQLIEGLISRAFLSKVNEQASASFLYFGGYIGDGNITRELSLPSDATSVTSAYMELDAGSDFTLYVNGAFSGTYSITPANVTNGSIIADTWLVNTSYLSNFQPGTNTLVVSFLGQDAFIGGGYMKIAYTTDELTTFTDTGHLHHLFPGVEGIINIYDSFYVSGDVTTATLFLHLTSNSPVFLTIGNTTVIETNASNLEQNITLNNTFLGALLDYADISKRTVPVRLGLRNVSFSVGGRSDAVLITDRTGSMDACDVGINCSTPGICDATPVCHERRDRVAQDSDEQFINEMLKVEGNAVGLIGYGKRVNPTCSFLDIQADNASLQNRIDDYFDEWCGWTCVSCGIAGATQLLTENKVLDDTQQTSVIDPTQHHVGDSGPVSVTETLSTTINTSTFIKSRLTIFARGVDTEDGYRDCVFFNNHYAGRICESNTVGSVGWHTCSYPIKAEWFLTGNASGTWVQTTQADFEAGTAINVNNTVSPGDVVLGNNSLLYTDNFDDDDISEYSTIGGNWFTVAEPGRGFVLGQTNNAHTILYHPTLNFTGSYLVTAVMWNEDNDAAGVAFRVNTQDADNLYSCSATADSGFTAGIWRHTNDLNNAPTALLGGTSWNYVLSRWYNITITVDETTNTINCIWESEEAGVELNVTATDDDVREAGSIGFWTSSEDNFKGDLLAAEQQPSGELLSQIFSPGALSNWSLLTVSATVPLQTNITLHVRTGNTSTPDATWDNVGWTDLPYGVTGGTITQAPGRYIQWRAVLTTQNESLTPTLHEISIDYEADYSTNEVVITGANQNSCFDTTGEQDDWDFKEVQLTTWHATAPVQVASFVNITEVQIGDTPSSSATTSFTTGIDPTTIRSAHLTFEGIDVNPDYYDCVYVNDQYIGRVDYQHWSNDNVWQNITFDVPAMALNSSVVDVEITAGTVEGCLRTSGDNDEWRFRNLNLSVRWHSPPSYNRFMSMLVMSDGNANTKIGDCRNYGSASCPTISGVETPSEEAVSQACAAHEQHGIRIYSVAFGDGADEGVMRDIACCDDCSNYFNASDAEELIDIYQQIAQEINQLQFSAQQANVSGNITSILYPDSYIAFNYTPMVPATEYGRIPVTIESPRFANTLSEGSFVIPPNVVVYGAQLTSYSGEQWTDRASIINASGQETSIYNLSVYGQDYTILGDPYIVNVPVNLISQGNNTARIATSLGSSNSTSGSIDDRIIYTVGVDIDINFTGVFAQAEGCNWLLQFEDTTNATLPIPSNYSGTQSCAFDQATDCDVDYATDAINNALCHLFEQIDFDDNGLLFIKFGPNDLDIDTLSIGNIPFMWGPTVVEVRISR